MASEKEIHVRCNVFENTQQSQFATNCKSTLMVGRLDRMACTQNSASNIKLNQYEPSFSPCKASIYSMVATQ